MECKVKNCNKPVKIKSKQLCSAHYERLRRYGDPEAASRIYLGGAKRPVYGTEKECKTCHVVKPLTDYYSRATPTGPWYYTYCKACHKNKMDAKRLERMLSAPPREPKPKVDHGDCAFGNCTHQGKTQLKDGPAGWFCSAHWTQWHTRKELRELRHSTKSDIDDRFRLCTSCLRVKTQESFHMHSSGRVRQSECKQCATVRVKFNKAMRENKYALAHEVYDQMAPNMQDKLKSRLEEAA